MQALVKDGIETKAWNETVTRAMLGVGLLAGAASTVLTHPLITQMWASAELSFKLENLNLGDTSKDRKATQLLLQAQ